MKKRFSTIALFLSAPFLAHADGAQTQQTQPEFHEYHNRMTAFCPTHITYERIKTDSIYVGVESWVASAVNHHSNMVFESEFRMGYNFFWNGRDHFTPLAGVGYLIDFQEHHHHTHHKPGIVYGTLGFLYDHEFNSVFNLGINVKGLIGGGVGQKRFDWGNPVVGVDTSLPITFRFGYKRRWDYRIEPFNIFLHGSNHSANYFGFRGTLGFRF